MPSTLRQRLRLANIALGTTLASLLLAVALALTLLLWLRSSGGPAPDDAGARREALCLLRGLRHNLDTRHADERMQDLFPEGSCFTWTLYGLAWANLAHGGTVTPQEREEALREVRVALDRQSTSGSLEPFRDTQVRRGVFWLGQRNLLLAKLVEAQTPTERDPRLTDEFHANSQELHREFLRSPTRHLDSYEQMCWPADNVTALASLAAHDRVFGTDYGDALTAWIDWTTSNACHLTGLPAGHLKQQTGQHIEPARGCANSWMVPLLAGAAPDAAARLYALHRDRMSVRRLGFTMFREYPDEATTYTADIDSGPIVWGAGVVATGVGLAAARSQGDSAVVRDIRDLSRVFGMPTTFMLPDGEASWHFGGAFPIGDAFLAWGWSVPGPTTPAAFPAARSRIPFHIVMLCLTAVLVALLVWVIRRGVRMIRQPSAGSGGRAQTESDKVPTDDSAES
jgi:hypothetical protein